MRDCSIYSCALWPDAKSGAGKASSGQGRAKQDVLFTYHGATIAVGLYQGRVPGELRPVQARPQLPQQHTQERSPGQGQYTAV